MELNEDSSPAASDSSKSIEAMERDLLESAQLDLASLALTEPVSELLRRVISEISIDATEEDRTPNEYRVQALWFMAISALRAFRSAINAILVGYPDQSAGHQRLVDELHNRARQVRADQSGVIAKDWILGKPRGKGAKLAGQEFWELMSGPVHANARAIFDWLAIQKDEKNANIQVGPERRPEVSDPAITYMAGEIRDIAVMLSMEAGISVDTSEIDAKLHEAQERFMPEEESEPPK